MARQGLIEPTGLFELRLPDWYLDHAAMWDAVAYAYSTLALIGAIWGAVYLRRRFKRRHAAGAALGQ